MLPYFLLFAIPILYSGVSLIINENTNQARIRQNRNALILFFTAWFLLLALRAGTIGVDLKNYFKMFEKTAKSPWEKIFVYDEENVEVGYQILCKLISFISTDKQVFLAIIAILSLFPIAYLFARESKNAVLSISIFVTYLFSMYFSGLRQVLAMGFAVPAYYFTKDRKLIKFILVVLLASTFHQSALVMLIFYPIYHFKMTKARLLLVSLVLVGVFVFNQQVFSFILNVMGGRYEERYDVITSTGAYSMLILFLIFAVYAFLVPQSNKLDKDTVGLRNILLLSLAFQCFALVNSVAMRMNYYFLIFLPILIAKIPTLCREKDKKIADFSIFVMITFFIFYFFLKAYTGTDILQVFPYIPFWEG